MATLVDSESYTGLDLISKSTPKLVGVDFFCGAGGATRGFLNAGIDIICGVDNDSTAKATYEHNNQRLDGSSCKFFCKHIENLSKNELTEVMGDRSSTALVFIGCPPCQPFTNLKTDKSNQGKAKNLLAAFFWQIKRFRPEYVVMENVPGIQSQKYGRSFSNFVSGLARLGYFPPDYRVLNAKDYGVPQSRRRMVLIASRLSPICLPVETHGPGRNQEHVSASVAFKFPALSAGGIDPEVPNHRAAHLSELNLRRIHAVKSPGTGREQWTSDLQLECYKKKDCGHTDVYGRMALDKPAPTLTTRFVSLSNGRFGHPTEDRAISLREGAALQTFDDKYTFLCESLNINARHIGNAVPVKLSEILARTIITHFNDFLSRMALPECTGLMLQSDEQSCIDILSNLPAGSSRVCEDNIGGRV